MPKEVPTIPDTDEITRLSKRERMELFVASYVADPNVTQATRAAGYPAGQAVGHRLLREPWVQAEIARRMGERYKAYDVSAERVMAELAAIAFSDIRDLYDENGQFKPLQELDGDVAASIAGLDVEVPRARGEEEPGDPIVKVKRYDKIAALKLLGQTMKMFTETVNMVMSEDLGYRLTRLQRELKVDDE